MDIREKLIEILENSFEKQYEKRGLLTAPHTASDLIANGVTVQECGRWKYYHKQNKAVCTICSFERDLDANFGKAIACPNCGSYMS